MVGPYESAVSMASTPSSTARRSTAIASSRSFGQPQTPGPVIRIAPNPSRCTVRPERLNVPEAWTGKVTTASGAWERSAVGLWRRAQVGLDRREALREALLGLVVADGGHDDHVLTVLPVDRGRDLVVGRQLQ